MMGRFQPFQCQGGVSIEQDVDGIAGLHQRHVNLQLTLGGTIPVVERIASQSQSPTQSQKQTTTTTTKRSHKQMSSSSPFHSLGLGNFSEICNAQYKVTHEFFAFKKLEKKQATDFAKQQHPNVHNDP
jgi:hypothetical protein